MNRLVACNCQIWKAVIPHYGSDPNCRATNTLVKQSAKRPELTDTQLIHVNDAEWATSTRDIVMDILKIIGLSIAAAATLTAGIAPAVARPNHKSHKVCKIERHHGHPQRVCKWVH